MAFDPITWAIGFAVTSSARRLGQLIFGRTLKSEIDKAAATWASGLGNDKGLHPGALFPTIVDDDDLAQRPALKTLRERLRTRRVPTLVEWHLALIEQWQLVRGAVGADAQPFFLLPESDARASLRDLSVAIVGVCEQDEALFRGTVLGQLDELLTRTSGDEAKTLPDPFRWEDSSTLREVALAMEHEVGARVEVLAVDEASTTVYAWSSIPGTSVPESKWSLVTLACILSGIPEITAIEIGIAGDTNIEGSDGRGPLGMMKVRFAVADVHPVAVTKVLPPDFWERARSFVLLNDNSPGQGWQEMPFRRFEEFR